MPSRRRNNAGRFRHRAAIYAWSSSLTAGGEDSGSWADSGNEAWGLLRPVRATEIERAQLNEGEELSVFETRYNSGLTNDKQLVINSKTYKVVGPPLDTDEQHRYMKVMLRREPI